MAANGSKKDDEDAVDPLFGDKEKEKSHRMITDACFEVSETLDKDGNPVMKKNKPIVQMKCRLPSTDKNHQVILASSKTFNLVRHLENFHDKEYRQLLVFKKSGMSAQGIQEEVVKIINEKPKSRVQTTLDKTKETLSKPDIARALLSTWCAMHSVSFRALYCPVFKEFMSEIGYDSLGLLGTRADMSGSFSCFVL